MPYITEEESDLFDKMRRAYVHAHPETFEGVYFICGEAGEKDVAGLPEFIQVCPAYGLDYGVMYQKIEKGKN